MRSKSCRVALAAAIAFAVVVIYPQGALSQACQNVGVSSSDFACAGFSRDTAAALNRAARELGFSFCTRQEVAMFLAQTKHEGGADPTRQMEFCAIQRTCNLAEYNVCSWNPSVRPAPGKHYRGRGPIQLSWSCNYEAAGDALGVNLLVDPDAILRDDVLSWKTALWYWNLSIRGASAHTVAWRDRNFGETTRKINGALECDNGPSARNQVQRVQYFSSIAQCMGINIPTEYAKLFCSPGLPLPGGGPPSTPAPPGPAGCARRHTIRQGDTCWQLWTNNGLSEAQFRALNPGIQCSTLQIGSSVCLSGTPVGGGGGGQPPPTSGGSPPTGGCAKRHTIRQGDTCWQLWNNNGLSENQFRALNPGIQCWALQIGSSLCLSGTPGGGGGGGGQPPPTSGGSPPTGGCTKSHTIRRGETCWQLWNSNGLSENQFRSLNPGINCWNLRPGASVCLSGTPNGGGGGQPGPSGQGRCARNHTIRPGDTCWQLWTNNGLTQSQFRALNPGVNCWNLKIGSALCVGG